jgi:H-type lectin domain
MGSKAKRQVIDGPMGILQGSRVLFSDYATDGPMWVGQGARESRHVIGFSEPFRRPPALLVGISLWDTDHNANMRADLSAEEVTEHGFHLVFRTWGDSRIAQLRADWTAIGPVRDEDSWDIE